METDCRRRTLHIERPEGGGDCLEWARRCRNRRRTDLISIRKCQWNIWWRNGWKNKDYIPCRILTYPIGGWIDTICCSISLKTPSSKTTSSLSVKWTPAFMKFPIETNRIIRYSFFLLAKRKDLRVLQQSIYLEMRHFRLSWCHFHVNISIPRKGRRKWEKTTEGAKFYCRRDRGT